MIVALSLGLEKIRQVICLQVPRMAEELQHVQMFTKVELNRSLSSQFSKENSHVYFMFYFLGHSFKIELESFFEFRVLHLKTKTKPKNHSNLP